MKFYLQKRYGTIGSEHITKELYVFDNAEYTEDSLSNELESLKNDGFEIVRDEVLETGQREIYLTNITSAICLKSIMAVNYYISPYKPLVSRNDFFDQVHTQTPQEEVPYRLC